MEFAPHVIIVLVDQLECVRPITVHVSETVRCATVAEQKHNLVCRLWTQADKIPKHVRVLQGKLRQT